MFQSFQTLSPEAKEQISRMAGIWRAHLGEALTGIYLHGSLALESFVEGSSDVDILIVTERKIPREERLLIAKDIIDIDREPSPLEMSALYINDLSPWRYPTFCQFHYSDTWTQRYQQMIRGELKENFIVDTDFDDHDIACHVQLTNQCGVCVYGKPISEVFPQVPEPDFWDSISRDIEDYDFGAVHPKRLDSGLFPLLGRILSYKREKRILSKAESVLWLKDYLVNEIKREG
jgi:streptomycin 3"-adenylyltransferase